MWFKLGIKFSYVFTIRKDITLSPKDLEMLDTSFLHSWFNENPIGVVEAILITLTQKLVTHS